MDLSLVYGSSDQLATSLRAGVGGRMNVEIRRNREWPPMATNKSQLCETTDPNEICYQAGKHRRNHAAAIRLQGIFAIECPCLIDKKSVCNRLSQNEEIIFIKKSLTAFN